MTVRTVRGPGEAAFRVQGSRFVGRVEPVGEVAAAESALADVVAAHPDASHVVHAYRIRDEPVREHHDNAGEPRGTAGPPVLNVLRGEDVEDVLAVVVRYFGGTELGTGGLVAAYGEAAKRALADTEIVERPPTVHVAVETAYEDSGTVQGILEGSPATFTGEYGETVRFRLEVPEADAAALRERIMDATSGRAGWAAD